MEELKAQKELGDLTRVRLETERLHLIPETIDYAEQIFAELTEEITRYMSFGPSKTLEERIERINKSREGMKKGTELSLVILDKKTKEFLGTAGVDSLDTKTPELGVWVKKISSWQEDRP